MGRYIDVDEEIRKINEVIFEKERDGKDESFATYCFRQFADALSKAPTADVEEVRHGKWIRNDNGTYSCSRCQSWIPNEQHHYARYCLYCGAKLDKETEE